MKVVVGLAVMLLAGAVCAGEGRPLFNGRDLSGWYTYLRGRGRNVDPKGVFSVTNVFTITGNTRICRRDIARDWQDAITVREADNEKPLGEWNRVELTCSGGDVVVTFNGRIVNRGFNAKPTRGRLQLQSEGCPIEFRNIVISPCQVRLR